MAETEAELKRKKLASSLMFFAFIPYWLGTIGESFANMFLAAFVAQKAGASAKDLHTSVSFGLGTIILLAYLWARPAMLYKKNPTPELREKVRRRFDNIHLHSAILLVLSAFPGLALTYVFKRGDPVGTGLLAALSISLVVQLSILPIVIDWLRTKNGDLMELLYDGEDLHSLHSGFAVPLGLKVALLITSCAFLPFGLAAAAFWFGAPPKEWSSSFLLLCGTCSITLLLGLGVVFYGVQRPMDGLIERMRRLAAGDFTKTRIYYSDEIARLKAGFNEMVDGLKERADLQDTFGKYLSIEIARELIKNKKVNLGGEAIEAAVMFCDIRNFTPLSETMDATGVVEFLNNYFRYVTPAITAHNGVINKFIGDAVMAVFTPQLGSGDYAADAVRAAAAMRAALAEFNASGKAAAPVAFGIGVHCGRLVAGNIGTFSRLEYTFIGDTVNVAARLQSKTKDFGTDVVVSRAAWEKAAGSLGGAFRFESLGRTALKGKAEPMEVYKLL
jgi:class 3 adenylate cyclase